MQKKFLWVLFFHHVEKIVNYFQNHTGRMIFLKMTLNLGKIRRNLRKKLRFDFFLFRLIFIAISLIKLKSISNFWRKVIFPPIRLKWDFFVFRGFQKFDFVEVWFFVPINFLIFSFIKLKPIFIFGRKDIFSRIRF